MPSNTMRTQQFASKDSVAAPVRPTIPPASSTNNAEPSLAPVQLPSKVFRVHWPASQTRYSFREGFRAKNQTTILNNTSRLKDFGLKHLYHQANISSPLISVYTDETHARNVALCLARKYGAVCLVVGIDTGHLARGPVFRAADLLKDRELTSEEDWIHHSEYLVMYRIPAEAIREETVVGKEVVAGNEDWKAPGGRRTSA